MTYGSWRVAFAAGRMEVPLKLGLPDVVFIAEKNIPAVAAAVLEAVFMVALVTVADPIATNVELDAAPAFALPFIVALLVLLSKGLGGTSIHIPAIRLAKVLSPS